MCGKKWYNRGMENAKVPEREENEREENQTAPLSFAAENEEEKTQTEGAGESRALLSDETESFSGNFGGLKGYYHIERIQPFDMFPQTRHVEVLTILRRV